MGFLRRSTSKPASPENDPTTLADRLRKAGADPAVPHITRHFLYVPGVKAAQHVARRLRAHGRDVGIETSARTGFWLVIVSQSMLVTAENLELLKREIDSVVTEVGGEYDRWQVDVAGG